jgi:hypothetical protein
MQCSMLRGLYAAALGASCLAVLCSVAVRTLVLNVINVKSPSPRHYH